MPGRSKKSPHFNAFFAFLLVTLVALVHHHPILGTSQARTLPADDFKQALKEGNDYLKKNQIDLAIREFKRALSSNPRSAEAHLGLGYAYRLKGSYELLGEAKAELSQALALDPSLVWARFYLARIYFDLGRLQKAEQQLKEILRTHSELPQVLALRGEVNRQLGNLGLALDYNQKALALDPRLTAGHYYLGLTYLDLGRKDEALHELDVAAGLGPPIADIFLALGSLHLEAARLEQAIEAFTKALQLDATRAESHLKLAKAYRLKGLTDRAVEELQVVKMHEKNFLNSSYFQELRAETSFEMGLIEQGRGQVSKAIDSFSQALAIYPSLKKVHRHLAEAFYQQDQYARALHHALEAQESGFPVDPLLMGKIKSGTQPER